MSADEQISRTLQVALKDHSDFVHSVLQLWQLDELIAFSTTGPVIGRFLFITIPDIKVNRALGPYVVSDRGIYVGVSRKKGWFSTSPETRFVGRSEVASARRTLDRRFGGDVQRSIDLMAENGAVLVGCMNLFVADGKPPLNDDRQRLQMSAITAAMGLAADPDFDF